MRACLYVVTSALLLAGCSDDGAFGGRGGAFEGSAGPGHGGVPGGPGFGGPRANGYLDSWQDVLTFDEPRIDACVAAVAGGIIVIGGHAPDQGGVFTRSDAIDAIRSDGMQTWSMPLGAAPGPVSHCAATGLDDSGILLIGGSYDEPTLEGGVWHATLSAGFELGAFERISTLPDDIEARGAIAWWRDSVLYVSDVRDGGTVIRARYINDALGEWKRDAWLDEYRERPLQATGDDTLFVLGGMDESGNTMDSAVRAGVLSTGAITAASSMSSLQQPRRAGAAIVVDSTLFVLGGTSEAGPADRIYSSFIDRGLPAPFELVGTLPAPRSHFSAATLDGDLYIIGGDGDDTVYRAQVRF